MPLSVTDADIDAEYSGLRERALKLQRKRRKEMDVKPRHRKKEMPFSSMRASIETHSHNVNPHSE